MCKGPILRHLNDENCRVLLLSLRNAVEPILANNLLPHFTDHSVRHSDRIVGLVDSLLNPLANGDTRPTEKELVVLYSACYLHDIGMQYERAGDTAVIHQLDLPQPWSDLQQDTRRDLLREHHHEISAELVRASVRAEHPPIGLQLNDQFEPGCIASLCEAHAIETRSDRYRELTEDGPGIRMQFLLSQLNCNVMGNWYW